MLMGMGSLATIAAAGAPNLAIAVLDNARYGETGSQPSHTGLTTDLAAVAAACGWPATATARDMAEVEALRPRLRQESLFAVVRISPDGTAAPPAAARRRLPRGSLPPRSRRRRRLIPVIVVSACFAYLDRAGVMQNLTLAVGRSFADNAMLTVT